MTRLGEKRASTRTTQRTGDSLEAETEQSEKDELEQRSEEHTSELQSQ